MGSRFVRIGLGNPGNDLLNVAKHFTFRMVQHQPLVGDAKDADQQAAQRLRADGTARFTPRHRKPRRAGTMRMQDVKHATGNHHRWGLVTRRTNRHFYDRADGGLGARSKISARRAHINADQVGLYAARRCGPQRHIAAWKSAPFNEHGPVGKPDVANRSPHRLDPYRSRHCSDKRQSRSVGIAATR